MKIVLLTNILSPYRKTFYDKLYENFKANGDEFKVLIMAESEPGRSWNYNMYKSDYTCLLKHKTVGFGRYFLHINFGLKNILKEIQPDIVVAGGSYTFPAVWETIFLHKRLKYKLLFWSESHLGETRKQNKLLLFYREKIRKFIYSKFEGFWYAGEKSLELITKYCNDGSKFIFVPNLVNQVTFLSANQISEDERKIVRKELEISDDKKIFVIPARLIEQKGIIPFLNLIKENPDRKKITIVIAGDGELREEIINVANKYSIDVRLIGYKQEKDMVRIYGVSDVFLLPSLSDANPLTCIEALWAGLPLLISKHVGNYPEVISENENGYVFGYDDYKEANNRFSEIVNNNEIWHKKAKEKSLSVAKEKYDLDVAVNRIVQEMHNLQRH